MWGDIRRVQYIRGPYRSCRGGHVGGRVVPLRQTRYQYISQEAMLSWEKFYHKLDLICTNIV